MNERFDETMTGQFCSIGMYTRLLLVPLESKIAMTLVRHNKLFSLRDVGIISCAMWAGAGQND